jgi:septal ring factor EnvC (AmiA/AmiB activator)
MKFKPFALAVVLIPAGFTACDSTANSEEIASIDSCLNVIDSLEGVVNGIKFDSLKLMADHVNKNEELIKEYYQPDTLNEEFGRLMNDCKGIRKLLSGSKMKEKQFNEEIAALRKQFNDLKTDAQNGLFTDEELGRNLKKEQGDLNILYMSLTDFDSIQKKRSQAYYSEVPKVDTFIANLIAQRDSVSE